MTDNSLLQRQPEESFRSYHVRLFDNMDAYGLDKYKIADLLNKEHGSNYDESKWRKDYAQYLAWKPFYASQNLDEEIVTKYEHLRIEAEKEKIRKQDWNREYGKLIRNQARFEGLEDSVKKAVSELEKKKPLTFEPHLVQAIGEREALVLFSDWHFGMNVENSFNKFNKEVFDGRVAKLVEKTIEYGVKNEVSTLHIAQLGDLVSGTIHVSTRVQSNEDIIEQVKYVSETLSEVLATLSKHFTNIKYYNVIGNHGRIGKRDEVGLKENFEYLIPWYLESRLHAFKNIEMITDKDGMIVTEVKGESVVLVHGNFDRIDKCVKDLPQLLGFVPKYIIGGHIHHNYEKEHGLTTVVTNGSLIGMDDYAVQGRYAAKPSQKLMVWNSDGLESTYIVRL